jgi:hypothetical protein
MCLRRLGAQVFWRAPDEATNEAKRHTIRPRNIDSTSLPLASGVRESTFVLVRILSCLALLNGAVMAAQQRIPAGGGLLPAGLRVEQPYDSLNFVSTLLALLGTPVDSYPAPPIRKAR